MDQAGTEGPGAVILSPRSARNRSMAGPRPIARGRVCVPPAPGIMPIVTSGIAKTASSEAIRTSHRQAISTPAPIT